MGMGMRMRNLTAIKFFEFKKNPKIPENVAGWRRGSVLGP